MSRRIDTDCLIFLRNRNWWGFSPLQILGYNLFRLNSRGIRRFRRFLYQLPDASDEPIGMVMKIDTGIEHERIPKGETLEINRQVIDLRHWRVIHQHRN